MNEDFCSLGGDCRDQFPRTRSNSALARTLIAIPQQPNITVPQPAPSTTVCVQANTKPTVGSRRLLLLQKDRSSAMQRPPSHTDHYNTEAAQISTRQRRPAYATTSINVCNHMNQRMQPRQSTYATTSINVCNHVNQRRMQPHQLALPPPQKMLELSSLSTLTTHSLVLFLGIRGACFDSLSSIFTRTSRHRTCNEETQT